MPTFYHDGVPMHYQMRGSGEPVVLIHGLGCSGADWTLQISALERHFCLIVPDLPGSGASPPPRGRLSIAGYAAALWSLLDTLDVPAASLVGFSMGGAVALEMALQWPGRAPRLALINTLAAYGDHWRKWTYARSSGALVRLVGMRRAARVWATGLFPDPWQQSIRDRATTAVAAVPADSYLAMSGALERWTATERLEGVTSRTLVIAAEFDHTPLAEKRALAARLRATLLIVRGSRHGTPFDSSVATNTGLIGLLSDRPLPPYYELPCDPPALSQSLFFGNDTHIDIAIGKAPAGI
jgi:pimeloyl-ACP methyl ester carboxylesterase